MRSCQLKLLRSCLIFCCDELAATRVRCSKISKLGMSQMVSEEETREKKLEEKYAEAQERVQVLAWCSKVLL